MGNKFDATCGQVTRYIKLPMTKPLNGQEEEFTYRLIMSPSKRSELAMFYFANQVRYLEMPYIIVGILNDQSVRSTTRASEWFDANHTAGCVSQEFRQLVWVYMCQTEGGEFYDMIEWISVKGRNATFVVIGSYCGVHVILMYFLVRLSLNNPETQ